MTALEEIVEQRLTDVSVAKQANWLMYEQLLGETAILLHSSPQMVQDVLLGICVEHSGKLTDCLLILHDFLQTFQSYQQHESKDNA